MKNGVGMPSTLHDLFDAHKRMLWGLAYRLTGCAADADDIVQDTPGHRPSSLVGVKQIVKR